MKIAIWCSSKKIVTKPNPHAAEVFNILAMNIKGLLQINLKSQ